MEMTLHALFNANSDMQTGSDRIQRLPQVGDQISGIFQSDRQADQSGRDSQLVLLILRQPLMRRGRRMGGDGFRIIINY